jgi:hypothetical protein
MRSGHESNQILLKAVREQPGLSMYELSREIGWKIGRVDGCVRRLLNKGKIRVEAIERNGRRTNLVFPRSRKDPSLIEVPAHLLGNPHWTNEAFLYALDNVTIGISNMPNVEWKKEACFTESVDLRRCGEKISLSLPERFSKFYHLNEKHKSVALNGNDILVTVSGDIIAAKKYPS